MSKFLRVKTDTKSILTEVVNEEYAMYGGRGLIAKILNDEVNPKCNALGPENKFIVCGGLLNGTTFPCSGRLSVGGKSPLTGGIKEANSGGTAGLMLARLGIKAIIIENQPLNNEWSILKIDKDKAELLPADQYVGMNTYALSAQLRNDFGEKIGMILIGTAGERGYRMASVQVTDMEGRPCRSAARGGLGAVMGSKGIKAIVLDAAGPAQVEYTDKKKFAAATRTYVKAVKADPVGGQLFPAIGTAGLVNMLNGLGAMPTLNFSDGRWDKAENICGEKLAEIQKSRGGKNGHKCMPGCIISCSNLINDENGDYVTGSLEYETIALNGSNLGIDSLDAIATIDRLCDDLGVDTIETGGMLGVCMEAGKIQFGDDKGAIQLIQEMMDDTEFGKILGNGAEYAGNYLGVKRIPVAKSQTMAGYDPRGLKGIGVTYATSPMGADHTAGNPIGNPTVDPYKKEGQVEVSAFLQPFMATCDSLGLCMHIYMPSQDPANLTLLLELMGGRFGGEWDAGKLYQIGKQTLALEKAFNKGAGFTAKDDKLPDFMYKEVLPSTGCKFDISQEEMTQAV
ncbi:putative oxidoreductase YdhV [Pelotomaculum schinkii]|uniref:Putative oxidoreductase YdhV n=1 Tax=Pelotomaculum schinkii TaxID=78350 RepID=A0A4Y7RAL5_9FIRM|nr:aldehyde ferredoxin oxidoreductase C-terminal domain-containing protein [Pelotomaculum schinkii]TEB05711.1 putative oxidoreductase YdhV [Pelotomaculum schinkii]